VIMVDMDNVGDEISVRIFRIAMRPNMGGSGEKIL
jgi:hypothetical protein